MITPDGRRLMAGSGRRLLVQAIESVELTSCACEPWQLHLGVHEPGCVQRAEADYRDRLVRRLLGSKVDVQRRPASEGRA